MSDALEVSIGGRIFISFHFADDIVVNTEEREQVYDIITSMDTTCTSYKMEIGPDKIKMTTNNPAGFK